jgi:hypothetical protein
MIATPTTTLQRKIRPKPTNTGIRILIVTFQKQQHTPTHVRSKNRVPN